MYFYTTAKSGLWTECKYRESSRYAHFGTGKNSHKWKIAYLESNVVMPCKVNLTIRMSNAQSSTYTV